MSDLTNKLINATYKKLLQVSTSGNIGVPTALTNVQTGDGSNTALQIATSAAQINGTLSVTNNLVVGGKFGVSSDVSITGDLQVSDTVCASAFYGDGSNLTGVTMSIGGNISVGNATVGGNLYVSGTTTVVGATHLQSSLSVAAGVSIGGAVNLLSTLTVSGAAGF